MITELEQAEINLKKIAEINEEIKHVGQFQQSCKANRDNVGDKIWGDKIKELKAERHILSEGCKYVELRTFAQVIKSYLTPEQYKEAWEKTHRITANPSKYVLTNNE